MNINGKYEIVEMEMWNKEDIDLTETGYIKMDGKSGNFHFICVDGYMDIKKGKDSKYKFTWEGNDESDEASGSGEFIYENETLTGRIYFHQGDDSSFRAVKINPEKPLCMTGEKKDNPLNNKSIDDKYPNIAEFVFTQGWIVIGKECDAPGFVKAIDSGGECVRTDKRGLKTLDDVLDKLENELRKWNGK